MSENILLALQITAVGMGLVFGAILLLWLVMALLVRFTSEKAAFNESETVEESQEALAAAEMDRKRRAAAAAVAVARLQAVESTQPHEFPLPPTAIVSAWQAVMRTRMLNKRGPTR